MHADMNINDLTYSINGAVFEVSRTLGFGFLEKVYENALLTELRERGLQAESQVPIKVQGDGAYATIIHHYMFSTTECATNLRGMPLRELYKRWRKALRNRFAGIGFKLP